jgi:protein SCO1/2/putative membrane protein
MRSVIISLLVTSTVASSPESLKTNVGHVAPFTLTDQDGKPFSPEQLRGKVWVAHFFYTACTQGCEKTIRTMKELQDRFRGKRDVAFVSVSVNPELDRPEHLAAFARDLGAEPGQWTFLSGPEADVYRVVMDSFKQGVKRYPTATVGEQVTHSFRLLVIDRDGDIVGYIDGTDPENVEPLIARIRSVARQRYLLPAINAGLNGTAAILLVVGYLAIRRRREVLHKRAMLGALGVSAAFLALYLYFHLVIQAGQPTRFVGPEPVKTFYLVLLTSHTLLAVVATPLALYVSYQGLRDRRSRHVKVARWTFPIWLYVSVTGVVVYVMLYHLYPPF